MLDYFLSDKGQAVWANAYLRPARPIELPAAIKAKFLPDSDYARAKSVDWAKMDGGAERLHRALSRAVALRCIVACGRIAGPRSPMS